MYSTAHNGLTPLLEILRRHLCGLTPENPEFVPQNCRILPRIRGTILHVCTFTRENGELNRICVVGIQHSGFYYI